MTRPTANDRGRWVVLLVAAAFFAIAQPTGAANERAQEISGGDYWFYEKMGMLAAVRETDGDLIGAYRVKSTFVAFKVKKQQIEIPEARSEGYRRAVEHLITVMRNSAGTTMAQQADSQLGSLTGEHLKTEDWEQWFKENRDYLVWSDRQKRLTVDQAAKQAGVPSVKYRQTHPWPQGQ